MSIAQLIPPNLLFFKRDFSDHLLDPLRWCGQKYYSQIVSDDNQGTIAKTSQLVQKVISRILLMPAIACAGLPALVGSLMKVFDAGDTLVKNCIIANISIHDHAGYKGAVKNSCAELQIPPTWEYEETGYDEIGELRPHHRINNAISNLRATLKHNAPALFTSVNGDNWPNYPFTCENYKSAKTFSLKVTPHFWNQFVHHLTSSFKQDHPRRITDPVSLNYSMLATEKEASKWRHVLNLILGIPQSKLLRHEAIKMVQLCKKIELYISDDLQNFQIISYGAV